MLSVITVCRIKHVPAGSTGFSRKLHPLPRPHRHPDKYEQIGCGIFINLTVAVIVDIITQLYSTW